MISKNALKCYRQSTQRNMLTSESKNMNAEITLSDREKMLDKEIRTLYNSGDNKSAVEKSIDFLREFPQSHIARYSYAVMHGAYSYAIELSDAQKKSFRKIGNRGIRESKNFSTIPTFQSCCGLF